MRTGCTTKLYLYSRVDYFSNEKRNKFVDLNYFLFRTLLRFENTIASYNYATHNNTLVIKL